MARPKKYNETFPIKAQKLAAKGLHDYQIAKRLGISEETYFSYKREFSEFSESIKRGREDAIQKVENSLFKRANGFDYTEVTEEYEKEVKIKTKKIKKKVLPDPTSMIFFLKNKAPENWKDRQDISLPDNIGVTIINDFFKE